MHRTENLKKKPDGFGGKMPSDQGRQPVRIMEQSLSGAFDPTKGAKATPGNSNNSASNMAPVVSVNLITYNHKPYIRECLDSLLMQETDFPYEICLGEDESTDGTREICIEYAARYPDKINLLLNSQSEPGRENYVSQGVYNYIKTTRACRGKYLALCDGDDAWTDSHKLQKQYEIMEADAGISLVHSAADRIHMVTGRKATHRNQSHVNPKQTISPDNALLRSDLILGRYAITASTTFMRTRDVLEIFERNREIFRSLPMGDIPTWCELVDYGDFYYIEESLGLWRILRESDSSSMWAKKKYRFVNGASNIGLMLGEKYDLPKDLMRTNKIKNCNRYALMSGDVAEISRLHDRYKGSFSLPESVLYRINRFKPARLICKPLYQMRYLIHHLVS